MGALKPRAYSVRTAIPSETVAKSTMIRRIMWKKEVVKRRQELKNKYKKDQQKATFKRSLAANIAPKISGAEVMGGIIRAERTATMIGGLRVATRIGGLRRGGPVRPQRGKALRG